MYDFESGDLSLDFANTMDWHASQKPIENLAGYADLIAWGEQAGLITPEQAAELRKKELAQPEEAARVYTTAIQLRDAIYRVFSSLYAGDHVPQAELDLLNNLVRQAMSNIELTTSKGELRWAWMPGVRGPDLIIFPIVRAAAELLTSERVSRVRECEDDRGCGYLFIDQTKNHSRRWCSMESCGNRAKARRHYARVQAS